MSASCDSHTISAPRAPKMRAWWQSVRWECTHSRIFAALSVQNAGVALIWPLGMVTVTHFCDVERSECERGAHPGNGRGNSYANSRGRALRMRAWCSSSIREGQQFRIFARLGAQNACVATIQSLGRSTVERIRVEVTRGRRITGSGLGSAGELPPWLRARCCF